MSPASLLVALCLAQAPAVAADEDEAEAPAEAKPAKKAQPPPATPPTTEEVSAQAKAPKPAPSEGVWKQGKPLPDMPPAKPVDPSVVTDAADGTARIGRALIGRDIETLVLLTPAPFSFDGVVAKTPAEVRQHWAETLDRHPVERLRLYGVEEMAYPQMVEKYGPPPARLTSVSLADTRIGIANLNGRATIVAWKKRNGKLAAVAISD